MASRVASILQNVATKIIGLDGQSLTYKRGVSAVTITARIGILGAGQKYSWFTSAESAAWTVSAPAFVVQVAGDFQPFSSEPAVGDFVLLTNYSGSGIQYDVKRWDKQRIAGVVIRTLLFVSKH